MTEFDAQLVDRIVRDVIARLQDRDLGASPLAARSGADNPVCRSAELVLDDAVLTEESLTGQVNGHRSILVGTRTVLTPTARDFLRKRDIAWSRTGDPTSPSSGSGTRLAIIATGSPAVSSAVDATPCTRTEIDRWKDATSAAVEHVRLAGAGVIVFTEHDAGVGCLANRHGHVRAAVVDDAHGVRSARAMIGPNVLVVDPTGKTFVTLREILREFAAGPIDPPNGWEAEP